MACLRPCQYVGNTAPVNILSLPDEILIEIFDAVRQSSPSLTIVCRSRALDTTSSTNDIANIRLTCCRFAATSSHLLIPVVHLHGMSSPSLDRLEAIAQHPQIGRGVRTVRLSTAFYAPGLADNLQDFAWYAINRVFSAAMRHQENIQMQRNRLEAARLAISETHVTKLMDGLAALGDVMEVLKSWSRMTMTTAWGREEIMPNLLFPPSDDDAVAAIRHQARDEHQEKEHLLLLSVAHALYRSRYQDQEELLADGLFVERFSQAMAQMPRAKVLEVVDFNHDHRECPTCRLADDDDGEASLGDEAAEGDVYDRLLDMDAFVQPISWEEAIAHGWSTTPPADLLFKLPGAIQQAGARLDRIAYATGLPTREYYHLLAEANAENFTELGAAVQALGIKSFAFLQADEIKAFAPRTPTSEDVQAFKRFIVSMTNSDRLERLRLHLGGGWSDGSLDPDHRHSLGGLLWPAPEPEPQPSALLDLTQESRAVPWGQNLRDLSISGVPFSLSDLSDLATHLRGGAPGKLDFLSLSRVSLVSGSWKEALDVLRGIEANCEKSLFAPGGAECDDVTMQTRGRYQKIFCAEPIWAGSVAECYINGEVDRNPLENGWAMDFVYSVDGDEVVVSVVSSEEENTEDGEDDLDSLEDESTAIGSDEDAQEAVLSAKGMDGPVIIVGETDDMWDESPSVEHVEYAA